MPTEEDAFFEVDSRLLLQLGEKLLKDRAVALAELIKNSYDADSTEVIISMENISSPDGIIIISDNGTGMSSLTFKKTWMRIATREKEEQPISKVFQRKKSGEKGIGRFASRMLSRKLRVKSVAQVGETKEELNAHFYWDDFMPGTNVNTIPISIQSRIVDTNTPTGTTLILEELNEPWNKDDLISLRRELQDLISPKTFDSKENSFKGDKNYDPGFKIKFKIPEFPEMEVSLDEVFFENAWARLSGCVDNKGLASYKLVTHKGFKREYTRIESFKYLRNADLDMYCFVYLTKYLNSSDLALREAEKIGEENGGIKVYSDNFRIFGYGRRGDDWLQLEYDKSRSVANLDKEVNILKGSAKRPGLKLFRNQQLFGHVVFDSKSNSALEITINRERLVENEAFQELKKFVRLGVDFSTIVYANIRQIEYEEKEEIEEEERRKREKEIERLKREKKEKNDDIKKANEQIFKADQLVRIAAEERRMAEEERRKKENERRKLEEEQRKLDNSSNIPPSEGLKEKLKDEVSARLREEAKIKEEEQIRKKAEEDRINAEKILESKIEQKEKIEAKIEEFIKRELIEEKERYESKAIQLRLLASTGTLFLWFDHEIRLAIDDIQKIILISYEIMAGNPSQRNIEYKQILDSSVKHFKMVEDLSKLVSYIKIGSRTKRKSLVLLPVVKSVFDSLDSNFKAYGIIYSIEDLPNNIRTPKMYESELISILHNLLSNSFKAVKGEDERRIGVKAFEKENELHIWILDTGKGLDKELWERVFDPFESYSEPDIKFGVGTGLGLTIVRDMIRSYRGEVKFIDAPSGWKTCVEIVFPKSE